MCHEGRVKRENQPDATNLMFIIKLLSQHVSGIIMPIIRRIRPCTTACGVLPGCVGCGWLWSCGAASWAVWTVSNSNPSHSAHSSRRSSTRPQPTTAYTPDRTPHAVGHSLILLMMGIMMPKTCWDRSLIINIELVASCWFLSLHPFFMLWMLYSFFWVILRHLNLMCRRFRKLSFPSS